MMNVATTGNQVIVPQRPKVCRTKGTPYKKLTNSDPRQIINGIRHYTIIRVITMWDQRNV